MEFKNFNFETVAKYGLDPIFRVRSEESVEAGSVFDESINKRVVKQIYKPRRLSDVLSDVDGYVSACLKYDIKKLGIVALRSRDVDYLIRVVTSYLKGGVVFKHDNSITIKIQEDGTFYVEPFKFEIDEWRFESRTVPRACLVNIADISPEQLLEMEAFERQLGRN